jgi:uncharacterized glyoxalase superfamily protein PhnB
MNKTRTSARTSVEVPTDPTSAFVIFTEDIDDWWQRSVGEGRRSIFRIEAGVGGRFLEIHDGPAGDMLACSQAGFLDWFQADVDRREHGSRVSRGPPSQSVPLAYEDVAKAAIWLVDAFGFEPRERPTGRGRHSGCDELEVGDSVLLRSAGPTANHCAYKLLVFVDDLDAHLARSRAHGAVIIQEVVSHADRRYMAEDLCGYRWMFVQAPPKLEDDACGLRHVGT